MVRANTSIERFKIFSCSRIIPSVHVNTSTDVQGEMIHQPPLQQLVVDVARVKQSWSVSNTNFYLKS